MRLMSTKIVNPLHKAITTLVILLVSWLVVSETFAHVFVRPPVPEATTSLIVNGLISTTVLGTEGKNSIGVDQSHKVPASDFALADQQQCHCLCTNHIVPTAVFVKSATLAIHSLRFASDDRSYASHYPDPNIPPII